MKRLSFLLLCALIFASSCGKKGPPQAPEEPKRSESGGNSVK